MTQNRVNNANNHTDADVAKWMFDKIMQGGDHYQNEIVSEIVDVFSDKFTYINNSGNQSITKSVLKEFGKLAERDIVWSQRYRYWRKREDDDDPDTRKIH